MIKEEIAEKAAQICWFHRIDLGHGSVTPGVDNSPGKLAALGIPASLAGKSVLDIGAWDGFFSFEAERRGAQRVLATDSFVWEGKCSGCSKAGFELARTARNSKVEDHHIDILDLMPEKIGVFDVVFCLGVLYHMRHPLLALERVAGVTAPGGMLILETHVEMLHIRRPAMAFYAGDELDGDASNWCGPNPACVVAMLKTAGYRFVRIHDPDLVRSYAAPRRWKSWREVLKGREAIDSRRMIFHAWK